MPELRQRKARPDSEHSQESPSPARHKMIPVRAMGSQKCRPPSARKAENSKSRTPYSSR